MDPSGSLGQALDTTNSEDFILQSPSSLVINDPKKHNFGIFK